MVALVALVLLATSVTLSNASPWELDPLRWAGGTSIYFTGPDVNNVPYEVPEGCVVDTAAFVSRHGARFPDPGSYQGWVTLASKIYNASFTVSREGSDLDFIKTWQPVVRHLTEDVAKLNLLGYQELYDMGVGYRYRYPDFYTPNTPFVLWSNLYSASPRVVDSARLFTRGYMGPNSTMGSIYVLNSKDPLAIANSLGPSDACPTYADTEGGNSTATWNGIYLPPITKRINSLLKGNLNFTTSDVSIFPTLCTYETAITGKRSQWCNVFSDSELRDFEYAQDLRYYYGHGPGSLKNSTMMLPVLNAIVKSFQNGPNKTYTNSDGTTFVPPPLLAMFANDGQINQLVSQTGVFDDESPLPSTYRPKNQRYLSNRFVTMKGTVGFERLTCSNQQYMRITLNDAVYPVPSCKSGPGASCPLSQYASLIAKKNQAAGSLVEVCKINATQRTISEKTNTATFLFDLALPFAQVVKP